MLTNILETNVKIFGERQERVMEMAYQQYLKLEELGYKNNGFMEDIKLLMIDKLPKYINSPTGGGVYSVNLVIPPGCRNKKNILNMIGSGSPLFSSVELKKVKNLFSAPNTPYFIINKEDWTEKHKKGKRFLTIQEVLSVCITEAKANTSFVAKASRLEKEFVGVSFNQKRDPRVFSTEYPTSNVLSCDKQIIY